MFFFYLFVCFSGIFFLKVSTKELQHHFPLLILPQSSHSDQIGDMLPEASSLTVAKYLELQEVNSPATRHDIYESW